MATSPARVILATLKTRSAIGDHDQGIETIKEKMTGNLVRFRAKHCNLVVGPWRNYGINPQARRISMRQERAPSSFLIAHFVNFNIICMATVQAKMGQATPTTLIN